MSELEQMCATLRAALTQTRPVVSALTQSADRLRHSAIAAGQAGAGSQRSGGRDAAAALYAAAQSCTQAATLLDQTIRDGERYIAATVGATGGAAGENRDARSAISPPGIFQAAAFATAGGAAFFDGSDDEFRAAALDVPPFAGEFVLDLHGTSDSVAVRDDGGNWHEAGAADFAEIVRSSTQWQEGTPIRLFACDTGAEAEGFAQQLADKLGVQVTAPTKPVWSSPDRSVTVSDGEWRNIAGTRRWMPRRPPNGAWQTFEPRQKEQT